MEMLLLRATFFINMDGWNNMTIDHVDPQAKSVDESVHNIVNLAVHKVWKMMENI